MILFHEAAELHNHEPMLLEDVECSTLDDDLNFDFFNPQVRDKFDSCLSNSRARREFGRRLSDSQLGNQSEISTEERLDSANGLPLRPMLPEEFQLIINFIQRAPQLTDAAWANKLRGESRGAYTKFTLPSTGEIIHCFIWDGTHFITSFDMIKILKVLVVDDGSGRMYDNLIDAEGKKFEENVFSVLRQLKVGSGSQLEDSRSDMLDWLQRHDCIRTLKKQKVFFWSAVDFFGLAHEIRTRCLSKIGISTPPKTLPFPAASNSPSDKLSFGSFQLDPDQRNFFTDAFMANLGQAATVNPAELLGWASSPLQDASAPARASSQFYTPSLSPAYLEAPFQSYAQSLGGMQIPHQMPYAGQEMSVDPNRKYICPEDGCRRWFKRREHMKRHIKTHTGERPHMCPRNGCQKTFSRMDNLNQHMRIHEKETAVLNADTLTSESYHFPTLYPDTYLDY